MHGQANISLDVFVFGGQASVVSIVSMLWYRRSGFRIHVGVRDSSLLQQVQTCSVNHPVHYSMYNGVRRPEREVNHAPLSSVKDKNGWSPTSTLCICLHSANNNKNNNNVTILSSCFFDAAISYSPNAICPDFITCLISSCLAEDTQILSFCFPYLVCSNEAR